MRRGFGQWWLDRGAAPSWQSRVVALLATTALFVAAFIAMTTLRGGRPESAPAADNRTTIVEFVPPRPIEPAPAPPVVRQRAPARPTVPPTRTETPPTVTRPPLVPAPPTDAHRDSTGSGAKIPTAPLNPIGPLFEAPTSIAHPAPTTTARGAPISRAGVTGESPALTPSQRDSIADLKMALLAKMARDWKPSAEDRREIAQREKELGAGTGRASPPGLSAGVSIPFPLFSKGPSPAERKRNEAIDADNLERLHRMQRVLAIRDSLRTDSLRRDSVARKNAIRP